MVRAITQITRVQPGGRIEVVSAELPAGAEAEVIVLLRQATTDGSECWGLFADDAEVMDRIVEEAMAARGIPLRRGHG